MVVRYLNLRVDLHQKDREPFLTNGGVAASSANALLSSSPVDDLEVKLLDDWR